MAYQLEVDMLARESSEYKPEARMIRYETGPKAQNGFESRSSSRSRDRRAPTSSTANQDSELEIMPKAQNGFESRSSSRPCDRRPPTSSTANQNFEWEILLYVPDKKRSMNAIVLLDSGCTVGNWVSWDFLTNNSIEGEMRNLDRDIIPEGIHGNPVRALGLISLLWKLSPEGRNVHGPVAFNVANSWSLGIDMIFGRSYMLRQGLVTTHRGTMLPLVPHKTAKRGE
jgi:hypothetical protein